MTASVALDGSWRAIAVLLAVVLSLAIVLVAIAPGPALRVILLAYPKAHARRRELIGELHAAPRYERPFLVWEQLELAVVEGTVLRRAAPGRRLWITAMVRSTCYVEIHATRRDARGKSETLVMRATSPQRALAAPEVLRLFRCSSAIDIRVQERAPVLLGLVPKARNHHPVRDSTPKQRASDLAQWVVRNATSDFKSLSG